MSDGAFPPVARDDASAAFFDAAARGELLVRRCLDSGDVLGPEARTCTGCGSARLEPFAVSGRGVLVTWAVVRQVPVSALRGAVPYVTAVVELAEGPWLLVRLVGTDGRDLRAGQPVSARFIQPHQPDEGSGAGSDEVLGEVLPVFAPGARLTARD